ncbi:MAG: RNA 2'-phosphotransferase [Roseivirga sp.]|nr:RNA 2'-phosphotransferase [Roseivirga sp.]
MDTRERKNKSKFLSLILRHRPEVIGLQLDKNGWASVDELLGKAYRGHMNLTLKELKEVVDTNDKKRFAFSDDFTMIRANQGHSISVDLKLEEKTPPGLLYHGTAVQNLGSIKGQGLIKGQRHHVHLSADQETALKVGGRHGKPVILTISAMNMYQSGIKFYQSENGVWLTDHVAVQFISFPK